MYTIIQNKGNSYGVVTLIVDFVSDVKTLPTHFTPGSKAVIIENSSIYMLNNAKTWVETSFSANSGSGGGSITPGEEITYDGGSF